MEIIKSYIYNIIRSLVLLVFSPCIQELFLHDLSTFKVSQFQSWGKGVCEAVKSSSYLVFRCPRHALESRSLLNLCRIKQMLLGMETKEF